MAKTEFSMKYCVQLSPLQQMSASCTGAIVTSLLMTPLDVVKIRLQAQQKTLMRNRCFLYCNGLMDHLCPCPNGNGGSAWYKRPSHFNGTIDAIVKISRTEGLASLWSGLPPTLIMAIPSTVIYFTAYEHLRIRFSRMSDQNGYNIWVPILAGGIARAGAATVISPLELVRTKAQSTKLKYKELGVAVRTLVQVEGMFSLWKGLGATLMRDVPFSALYWTNYEYLKATCKQHEPTLLFSFLAGASSGTVAAVLTLPFDVVKTHRQLELGEKEIYTGRVEVYDRTLWLYDNPSRSRGTIHILKDIYKTSGPAALFTGIVPRVVKVAPACAIMISTYEYGKKFFRRQNERKCAEGKSTALELKV